MAVMIWIVNSGTILFSDVTMILSVCFIKGIFFFARGRRNSVGLINSRAPESRFDFDRAQDAHLGFKRFGMCRKKKKCALRYRLKEKA